MFPIKICGVTKASDAKYIAEKGIYAMGLIFYQNSPRYINKERAKEIVECVKGKIKIIGVFVNENIDKVFQLCNEIGIDIIQLHGNESSKYCSELSFPIIKAIHINKEKVNYSIEKNINAVLLDNKNDRTIGGTGETFSWELNEKLHFNKPIILSGGIKSSNVEKGIEIFNPIMVDINSGVEISPGIKDKNKIDIIVNKLDKYNFRIENSIWE